MIGWCGLAVLSVAAVALAPQTVGSQRVYRCADADGHLSFTTDPASPERGEAGARPSPGSARSYALPGDGALELEVPAGWRDSVEQRQPGSAPTISFVPALGDEFLVLLTPSRDPGRLDFNSPARVRAFVERSGQGMLGGSVEKAVVLESLSGTTAQGFYYTLTDRAAVGKPSVRGDYPYVTQGAVATGDLLVVFSIFHRTKDGPERQAALVMVAGLRQQGKGAAR